MLGKQETSNLIIPLHRPLEVVGANFQRITLSVSPLTPSRLVPTPAHRLPLRALPNPILGLPLPLPINRVLRKGIAMGDDEMANSLTGSFGEAIVSWEFGIAAVGVEVKLSRTFGGDEDSFTVVEDCAGHVSDVQIRLRVSLRSAR